MAQACSGHSKIFDQREAIVHLLEDDDPPTVALVKQQLAAAGSEAVPDLKELLAAVEDRKVQGHLRAVLGTIDSEEALHALNDLCPVFGHPGDLEKAQWLLARTLLPGVDVEHYRTQLDRWGEELANLLVPLRSAEDRVLGIAGFLGQHLGFHGNSSDYYNASNSLLPRVMDTRQGIPISLSILYQLVGGRAGMKIQGINFPGHFLACHEGIFFDPFQRGRILDREECEQVLESQNLVPAPEHFAIASERAQFIRILANLLYIYKADEDDLWCERIAQWIHALERSPEQP